MIIESLLDTDLYKFTMMQAVLHHFPGAMVEYRFKCRSVGVDLRPLQQQIEAELNHFCQLRCQAEELDFLRSLPYIKGDFVEFLRIFKANRDFITIDCDDDLQITIRGPWLHTILFEVPILAIISELYFQHNYPEYDMTIAEDKLMAKIDFIKKNFPRQGFIFSDFGTRRRFSKAWHKSVVSALVEHVPENLAGTSNTHLAHILGITPIGTMAHEYIQACQSLGPRLLYSQKFAFEKWAQEYRGDLGIALSDTYSIDAFLNDFDMYFCKLFDGARQDSGDPIEWARRVIEHYHSHKVDPKTKTLVFSDSLTFEKVHEIYQQFHQQAKLAFGIGTHLCNDVGLPSLDMVIKMVSCNGQPVAKVSDAPGKTMCQDQSYLHYLKEVFNIKE